MAGYGVRQIIILGLASGWLAACQMGTPTDGGAVTADGQPILDATVNAPTSVKLIDRDVEAPDVFQVDAAALWDGRPSLGGVWVASPDAKDPERVIMRNPANGKFVIGALFRRERDNPGPTLQISSDAADALGMLAGEPSKISVTALRREEAPAPEPDAAAPLLDTAEAVGGTAASDVVTTAAGAIDAAEGKAPPAKPGDKPAADATAKPADATAKPAAAKPAAEAAAPAAPAAATTGGALIQVGIFSVEANAKRAVDALAKAGITASVKKGETQGKAFWSVTVRGDASLLAKIKSAGFGDAYLLKK